MTNTAQNNLAISYDESICSNPKTISADGFINLLDSINCYELIPDNRKVKPYFDIEIKQKHCKDGEEYQDNWYVIANTALTELKNHFPNAKFCYLNASSPSYMCCVDNVEKWIISIHIIIYNYKISKKKCKSIVNQMNQKKYELNYDVNEDYELFDDSVYNPNGKMRSAFASKSHYDKNTKTLTVEEGRPLLIESGTKEQSVISAFFDDDCFEIMDDDEKVVDTPLQKTQFINNNDDNKLDKIVYFMNNGFMDCCNKNRQTLLDIGYALSNEFKNDGLEIFLKFAEYYSTASNWVTEYEQIYDNMIKNNKGKIKLGTIYWIFREYNSKLFNEINRKYNIEHSKIDMIEGINSTGITADYFKQLYGDKVLSVDGITYIYNGIYWVKSNKKHTELISFIDKVFYKDLIEYGQNMMNLSTEQLKNANVEEAKTIQERIKKISAFYKSCLNNLRGSTKRGQYIDDIISFTTDDNVEFDSNPYLFAFKNKIFDLENNCFIDPNPLQYINKTCGYDFIENNNEYELKDDLNKLIDSIFPNKKIRDYYLTYLSTGLSGIQMENFFIATGVGGNGKSLINGLMMNAVGEYGYVVPASVFTSEIKTGANPELANLHNIRFALTAEPDAKKRFCCSTIKTMTGDSTLPVRALYSDKVGIKLMLSLLCEANDVPDFDEINQAVNRRVRCALFEAIAIDKYDYDKLDEEDRKKYIVKNEYYKTRDFINKYKQTFVLILAEYFQKFLNNNKSLPEMPSSCKQKIVNLLAGSDGIYSWFEDKFEPLQECDMQDSQPIKLTDIYKIFSSSVYFNKLNKADQRNLNQKKFLEKLETNIFLQKYIKCRGKYFNGKQLKNDCITGWVQKIGEENDSTDNTEML